MADDGPVRVDRCAVPDRSVRFARATAGGDDAALDSLIDRELLAQAALAAGVREPSRSDIERAIRDGDALAMGAELPPGMFNDGGAFDYKRLIRFAQSFGLADADAFVDEQIREHLAREMRGRIADLPGWLAARCAGAKIHVDPALAPSFVPCG